MNNNFKILLAEDDLNLGILLLDFLEAANLDVKLCRNGSLAIKAFKQQTYHLCLLDIMMPQIDGFEVAKEIKKIKPQIPIIFITAKSQKEDKLKGYKLGCDDYISKPFDEEELLWKIQAILRRIPPIQTANELIFIGEYTFDFEKQSLSIKNKTKRITEKETQILHYLFKHKNTLIKREVILTELWGSNDYFLGRSLDVFITKIRKYLKADPQISIENVFGVGFIFNVPS